MAEIAKVENIYTKLMAIQAELEVPKLRENNFGQRAFKFRNAEDILAAAKPVCHKHGCVLTLTDTIKMIGQRYYVEATATLFDGESAISTTASAREEESRKGFDGPQITGSASSYARKYALGGLLNLDDEVDPDSQSNAISGRPADTGVFCPSCGGVVEGYTARNGSHYTPEQALAKDGMCLSCLMRKHAQS